jgi:hypothetical protein
MRFAEENNLAFIETSALDASGVDTAFHRILTGASRRVASRSVATWAGSGVPRVPCSRLCVSSVVMVAEIYSLLSKKPMAGNDSSLQQIPGGQRLDLSAPQAQTSRLQGNCCKT